MKNKIDIGFGPLPSRKTYKSTGKLTNKLIGEFFDKLFKDHPGKPTEPLPTVAHTFCKTKGRLMDYGDITKGLCTDDTCVGCGPIVQALNDMKNEATNT